MRVLAVRGKARLEKGFKMNAAGLRELHPTDEQNEVGLEQFQIPVGAKNYITPAGYRKLKTELLDLLDHERPDVVRTVAWAAANGDRSENADYIYGKRRLRAIDKRIRFLTQRLDQAQIVDSRCQENLDQVFFGAMVTYALEDGAEHSVTIVGVDEINLEQGYVSWVAPIARALLKAKLGDLVTLQTPTGTVQIEVLKIQYPDQS
ncbi:transcription elongation factor GreB [Mycoavidus cysteinexigens]|uniref:Transcription elongation factor GreB n=2 Tax=Mycoavidus cysteinexigens TaxID=1553431 RepID=A0A2Z6ETA9_9BURK|nr:transcription elongation factor GreB [Mycoavidus cysteinexigens]GLR01482.1 transcription elongation factor GreB [Mycoavidus cysteinexigens]